MTSLPETTDLSTARPLASLFNASGKPVAETFTVYADGSSLGNPGPGGWACVIVDPGGNRRQKSGPLEHTTNNRAELHAALEALLELPRGARGVLRLDSEYVVRGLNEWRKAWERNGWKNSKGQGVANHDLFKALFALSDTLPEVRFKWVRGHAGDELNELADTLARAQAAKAKERVQ